MNFSKLLVLSALCLTATSAMAEIVDGVRQRPAVTQFAEFQQDQVFYLYNVKARRFFVGANDWNTRASIDPKGYLVTFADPGEAAIDEGILEFKDSVETKGAWFGVFATADGTAIWVDNNTENYRFWFVNAANGAYRITNPVLAENNFLGWKGSEGDTRLYLLEENPEYGIDWQFVDSVAYNAYQATWAAMKDQYAKAQELLSYLNSAKEQGVDVSVSEAVYLNEDASVEELEAAIKAVQKAINDHAAAGATVDNPKDMTGSLLNPTFENASADGWKGTSPNMVGSGAHGPANVAEHYNKTFDTYQDLNNMPAGVYKLSATSFFRGSWSDHANHANYVAYLYARADGDTLTTEIQNPWDAMNTESMAGDTEWGVVAAESSEEHDGTTYFIPNDPSAGRLYFERGFYKEDVFFAIESDSLRVGVMKNKSITGSDWVVFDNFSLTYYGNKAEAFQYWLDQAKANKTVYEEGSASQQYIDAYDQAFNVTVASKAEAVAAMKAIQAAADSIAANAALWNTLKETRQNAVTHTVGDYATFISAQDLGDYLLEIEDDVDAVADWSNTEIQAIIDKLNEMIKAVEKEKKEHLEPNADVTYFMKNPSFDENGGSTTGWTIVSKGGGNVQLGGNAANHCFEAWHSTNFDVYQELTDLPLGVYQISVQGYVRYKDGQEAIAARNEVPENIPIYVYMNESKTHMANWFDYPKPVSFYKYDAEAGTGVNGATYLSEDDDNAYPDNMTAASAAFADGGYTKSACGLVADAGDVLRIGVKGNPTEAMFWPIFDNFKLTYLGYAIDVVKPVLEDKLAEAASYNDLVTTKAAKDAFTSAYATAQDKLNAEEGIEMFRALSALIKAMADVSEGAALCDELAAAVSEMMTIASESSSTAANEAMQLGGTILSELEACELEAEAIESYKIQIREMILKMQLPENYAQGSEEGVDVTAFIQTPSFSKTVDGSETNSIDGWQGTSGYNFGNDATQKGALALEFYQKTFDMYQDLEGVGTVVLPNGWYKVSVNAFERVSESSPAFFYAVSGEEKAEVELMKHEAGVDVEGGEAAPSDMVSSAAYFEEGRYLNELFVKVSDNKMRIGIKHEAQNGGDWIIMDNFKLYFFGENQPASSVKSLSLASEPVMVEFFSIDGRRVNGAQKGITIKKTTLANGVVVVRKIRK